MVEVLYQFYCTVCSYDQSLFLVQLYFTRLVVEALRTFSCYSGWSGLTAWQPEQPLLIAGSAGGLRHAALRGSEAQHHSQM